MFELINFVITQLWRIRKCMQQPLMVDYAPDSKSVADVSAMITAAEAAKGDFAAKSVSLTGARGELELKHDKAHGAAVSVYAGMRSIYRRDPVALRQLLRIPKKDDTAPSTLARMQLTSEVWGKLPNAPGTDAPFKQGKTTRAVFDGLYGQLEAKHKACVGCEQDFGTAQAALTGFTVELENFTLAAVTQGRAQFLEGTPERTWIDTIPSEPSQQAPEKAVMEKAESPAAGVAHLEYEAKHATSYTIQHKGPGEAEYVTVAENVSALAYDVTGLAAGEHLFVVTGRNSRGEGPVSAVATVRVAVAAVA